LISVPGPIVMAGPPKISARWFPPDERTLATAVISSANNLGAGVGFVIPSYLVQAFGYENFLLIEAAAAAFIFVLTVIYFPESPPTPPSVSAQYDEDLVDKFTKETFWRSIKEMFSNYSYVILSLVGGWQAGLLIAWGGLFDEIFNSSFNETFVGWLGFIFIAACVTGSLISGILCDKIFQNKFKRLLLIFFVLLGICLVLFTLAFPSFMSPTPILSISPYVSATLLVLCGIFYGFCTPIFYEFGVELTFPISSVLSSGFLSFWINIVSIIFLMTPVPTNWFNGIAAFYMILCIFPLLFVTETYDRAKVDQGSLQTLG